MKLMQLCVGMVRTNCYIVYDEATREAAVIDPGDNAKSILHAVNEEQLNVKYVLLTHAHFDHMLYARPWLKDGVKLYVHKLDAPALADPSLNLSGVVGAQLTLPDADVLLEEGGCVEEAGIRFDVLHTPGHTPGSVCYRHEKTLFCGDTLFYQGYGRVDLAGGNSLQMALSLKRLLKLPGDTVCYPGHGMKTKIAWEQEANA